MGAGFFGKWILFQSKRLFRKPGFLLLLLAVPLFTLALSILSEDSGFSRISLSGGGDELSLGILHTLEEETGGALRFTLAGSEEEAVASVREGRADAAWIFPADLADRLTRFVRSGYREPPGVRVVEREETVALRLAREKLSGTLYEPCARALFLAYLRGSLGEGTASLSDEELLSAYDAVESGRPLFLFVEASDWIAGDSGTGSAEGSAGDAAAGGESVLLAPVRGLLSLFLALSGAAASLFAGQEEEKEGGGSFALLSPGKREAGRLLLCLLPPGALGILTLLSLFFAGLWRGGRELPAMGLYFLCCGLFGAVLGGLLRPTGALCAAIPLLALGMLGLCPIFLPPPLPAWIPAMLPPTHYLACFQGEGGLLSLFLYTLALALLAGLLAFLRARTRGKGR